MNVINFQDANCANCYKCLRNCDVNAIRIKRGKAQIVSDMCVFCGRCMELCPQNAKTYDSDLAYVKSMLYRKEKIVVSLDPTYRGLMSGLEPGQIVAAFRKLGFAEVRETAEAAAAVTEEYVRLMREGTMDNIISSTCPSVVYLIEKYYPSLIPNLAPVLSPMLVHGRMIREMMGKDTKVVFVGPCVAKKMEAEADPRTRGYVDAVIEFKELAGWFAEKGIDPGACEPMPFANEDPMVNRLYAVPNGVVRSTLGYGAPDTYKIITVNGFQSCREFLHSMRNGDVHHCFVEMNICTDGCVNGPGVEKQRGSRFSAAMRIEDTARLDVPPRPQHAPAREQLKRSYENHQVINKMPEEAEIRDILKEIGRSGSDTEFNCGACGYLTCRDMANAIYQGQADSAMCLVRSYENTRSQANVVLSATPNMIVICDRDFRIREFNRRAQEVFHTNRREALQMYLFDFMDTSDFEDVFNTHTNILRKKRKWPHYRMTVLQTLVYIAESDRVLGILEDVTEDEQRADKLLEDKVRTVRLAQSVIDKQMTTAQEIAGLLGETTAETKAILTKLRNIILENDEAGQVQL